MSNNKDSNKSNKIEPKFDEFQAYEELRLIFVIAIETQNFDRLPAQIEAWKKKYPLAEFTDPGIIIKVRKLLDREFLTDLIGRYLADQICHIQEKQKEFLLSIQSILALAEKTKDYETAQKEITRCKNKLKTEGLSLYSFSPNYKRKICTLLLIPGKELRNQEDALRDLKQLKDKGTSLDSKDYSKEIDDWQNKYCIKKFPDKLQKELNSITAEVFTSISVKRTEETALEELEAYAKSPKTSTPIDDMASILSKYDYNRFSKETQNQISKLTAQALSIQESLLENDENNAKLLAKNSTTAVQLRALNDLRNIFIKSNHDSDALLNWIYVNRKINFSEFARNQIINQFTSVGYKIPSQSSYYIPEISLDATAMNSVEFERLRKNVIVNYLGILAKGNSLSKSGKENITAISTSSAIIEQVKNSPIVLPVFDNVPEVEPESKKTSEKSENIDKDTDTEDICNIIIEDIINDPLTTYSISTVSSKSEKSDLIVEFPQESENSTSNSAIDLSFSAPGKSKNTGSTNTLPVDSEQENTNSSINSNVLDPDKSTVEYSDNITINTTSLQEVTPYSLTLEDQYNLEKVNELSTYIVVTAPILQMVHSHNKAQIHQPEIREDIPQKNNGF